jgi:hypothetical protein
MTRLLLAVNRKCVLVGLTLTDPILLSESPYRPRFRPFCSRRSTCVTPPELSDIHNSWPVGGRSMLEMRISLLIGKDFLGAAGDEGKAANCAIIGTCVELKIHIQ